MKEEGIAEGRAEEKIEIAWKMLLKGKNIEEIMDITGLSTQEIAKLKA